MGGCDLFLAECGWVWVDVGECGIFFVWMWVRVGECDLFLTGCGWVWVSVTFFWPSVGRCG